MKIARTSVHLRTIPARELPVRDFIRTVERSLHCFRYRPIGILEEAMAGYGFLEIYANGAAKVMLESPDSLAHFIRNQKAGMPFELNLGESFPQGQLWVLRHETEDTLAFLSGPAIIKKKVEFAHEQRDTRTPLDQVIAEETGRTSERRGLLTLDVIEGNIRSADDAQATEILIDAMLRDFPLDKEDRL